jgi:hopanoid biosynthesis associated protein HpnK
MPPISSPGRAETSPRGCRLIVNADDLGWSEGVNAAICALHDEGIVTSASLMVGAPALSDALARLRTRPHLAVGLHLTLVAGPSLLPPREIPHLADERGWFSGNCVRAGVRYTFLPACRRELRRELAAQFAAFERCGLGWSHVDSHLHFALVPVFFREALKLCRGYPVIGFRIPEDDYPLYRRLYPREAPRQRALAGCFSFLCASQRRAVERAGYRTTERCFGLFRTGRLDAAYLERLAGELPDGEFEMHCHPDLSTVPGKAEFEALRSGEFRRALEERGVVLSTYTSLEHP